MHLTFTLFDKDYTFRLSVQARIESFNDVNDVRTPDGLTRPSQLNVVLVLLELNHEHKD